MTRPKKAAKKTTPWMATEYTRHVNGETLIVFPRTAEDRDDWVWLAPNTSGYAKTKAAAQRAAMAAVRGAKG